MQISKRTIVVVFKSRNEYTSIQSWNKEQPNHHRISNTSDTLKQPDENVEEKQKVGKVMVNFPEKENKIMHIYKAMWKVYIIGLHVVRLQLLNQSWLYQGYTCSTTLEGRRQI